MVDCKSVEGAFLKEIDGAVSTKQLEELKVRYLGRKGPIQELMRQLKECNGEQKPLLGKAINELKISIENKIAEKDHILLSKEEAAKFAEEAVDVTLPGRRHHIGRKHLITQMLDQMLDILRGMGFSVQYGPDIDSEFYNFEALNFPPDHPARDMQDTFYLDEGMLLRTHTSNVQTRVMEGHRPPIRIAAPGRVYRNETITARSHVFFHQVEALYIDTGVSFADLLSTLDIFLAKLFEQNVQTRYRPSYFPFVEPGMEVDLACLNCSGNGCVICKQSGWLEVAGAGMVHPEVLKVGDIDPEEFSGYAWGMGVERLVMLKYGIQDIRLFTENQMQFLEQFPAI